MTTVVTRKNFRPRTGAADAYQAIYSHTNDTPVDQMSPGKTAERDLVSSLIGARKSLSTLGGRKVVALDIDGVMANFNAAMKPYSLAPEDEHSPHDYNFVSSGWFTDFDHFENAHLEVMDSASQIPLNDPTAGDAIHTLRGNGFEVIAVTARREQWREETLKFFARHNIPIADDQLHFMHNKDKTSMHYDYLLDDAPKNIVDTLSNSQALPVVFHQRYNDHLPMDRVRSMKEFADLVICHDRDNNMM